MTPQESAKSKAAVMLAFAEGKAMEYRAKTWPDWKPWLQGNPMPEPAWNWTDFDYRIKREPREFYLNLNGAGDVESGCFYQTKDRADECARSFRTECIRAREVL